MSILHWIAVHYVIDILIVLLFIYAVWGISWGYITRNPNHSLSVIVAQLSPLILVPLGILIYLNPPSIKNPFAGISAWMDEHGVGIFFGIVLVTIFSAIVYWLLPSEERPKKKDLYDEVMGDLDEPIKEEHIVTCPQGVVRYRLTSKSLAKYALNAFGRQESIDSKIRDILETNPDSNLKEYEGALGITVLSYRPAGGSRKPRKLTL